jgi:CRP/FNR family transcriptional regulator, cyclic AMP receptor protein
MTMTLRQGESENVIPLLEKVPIFGSLNKAILTEIAKSSTIETYEPEAKIAAQGEEGTSFCLVLNGLVEVRRSKRIIAKLRRGGFFGEMAILDGQPRSADVVALEKTSCLALSRSSFKTLIESNPDLALGILQEVVRRLRETTKSIHHSFFS